MNDKKCIVFDLDGTLFDTKPGIIDALNYVFEQYGMDKIPADREWEFIGPPVRQSFIGLCGMSAEKAERATALYRQVYVDKYISDSKPYDGAEELLAYLKNEGHFLGIATMKTRKQVDKLLSLFGFTQYFDIVKCAAEDGSLSKSEMLETIRNEHNDCVDYFMVGDTSGDMKAAYEARYTFVFSDYGYGEIDSCQRHIHFLKEVIDYL